MSVVVEGFAEALRALLDAPTLERVEGVWQRDRIEERGWKALATVDRSTDPSVVPPLDEADGLLLRLLDRLPLVAHGASGAHFLTFRIPALERLQHATAAALVAHRFGTAGLATVATDARAPTTRRYHAFLLLARLHAHTTWPLFERYLVPEAHHAFLGVAAEAARYYPNAHPAGRLVALFDATRRDFQLRAFLGPRLLESLFVLADPVSVPLCHELATAGHTDPDPTRCEVTVALVILRRLTGVVPVNSKFPDEAAAAPRLDQAEVELEAERDVLRPVVVL
ncbi:MAG: hypothetical protein OEY20_12515 [Gemmatimonadota bacterium]|nr:hypothetical protein [Gemmatimonadota bacterium]MDH4350207.1 hypothetical protein [Gemmatimonadota bacterium]MDH5198061.1 hypothetical protein [Gemmatimonadota bacterium]